MKKLSRRMQFVKTTVRELTAYQIGGVHGGFYLVCNGYTPVSNAVGAPVVPPPPDPTMTTTTTTTTTSGA
jgi:hypothetical protein